MPEAKEGNFDDRIVIPITKDLKAQFVQLMYIERDSMANAVRKMVRQYIKRKTKTTEQIQND